MALTYTQCQKIRATIPALNTRGEEIIAAFYQCLLRGHPELRSYFNTANQENKHQPRAMASLIIQFANNVNHIYELIPKMERICQKHCSVGVQPHHYEPMGQHLLEAFTSILDPSMTLDAKMAWKNAYWMLANMFIAREKQLYKSFGSWTGWRQFEVVDKVPESQDIVSFYLKPQDGKRLPTFMPGQYVSIRVKTSGKEYKQIRQYALSEAPNTDYFRITVERSQGNTHSQPKKHGCPYSTLPPGAVSNHLIDNVVAGSTIELSHPAGHVFLDTTNLSNAPVVLLSTGIGATPMLSILSYLDKHQPERPISWISTSNKPRPFKSHIEALCATKNNLRCADLSRLLDAHDDVPDCDKLNSAELDLFAIEPEDLYLNHECTEYYICGPESTMAQFVDLLGNHGVDKSRIKCELQTVGKY
ncbi:hypothetical protein QQS21_001417 [Conoideocrella luteorostrata]|uniref:nitric oxide dioxygenase n=1 Tax=Conoideocrella luteorostrata TaxID=1105319 RepID=A0AAJ0G202_9HYPO|nr:hypothetical protein QQS21_001417 [Conoideocrella luteorostrata]